MINPHMCKNHAIQEEGYLIQKNEELKFHSDNCVSDTERSNPSY